MVDLIVSALAALIGGAMTGMVNLILPVFNFNFETFVRAFPFAGPAYNILQAVALGIVLLLATIQVISFIVNSSRNKSTPIRIGLSAIIAVTAIYYGNYILEAIMDIAQGPYSALLNANADYGLADVSLSAVFAVADDIAFAVSVPLYIILILLIGIAFIKLLLEAVERYVVLFVLVYLSPLASSTLASEATSGIFKRFFTMFIAQSILLILNVWSLRMISSLFIGLYNNESKMIALLMGYAFLRVAAQLDTYLNSLGLNAAITGAGLGGELMATGAMLLSKAIPSRGNKSFSNSSGTGSVLGMTQKAASALGKLSPLSGLGAAAANAGGALVKTSATSVAAAKDAKATGGSGVSAFKKAFKDNIGKEMHDAGLKTQGQNWAASFFGGASTRTAAHFQTGAGSLTDQTKADISKHAHLADTAFSSASSTINDASVVGSVMKGIGMEQLDGGADAVSASLGAIPAENMQFSMGSNGIHAEYEMDGKTHSWDVKGAAQFASLPTQDQQGYEAFRSDNGSAYYYRHITGRAPTQAQKTEAELSSAISAFAANPIENPMTPQQWSQSKQAGTRHLLNQLTEGYKENGTSLEYSEQTVDSCQQALDAWSSALVDCGVPKKAVKRGEMAMLAVEDVSVKEFTNSANGLHMAYEEDGREYEFGAMTVAGMEAHGIDYSTLRNKGYLPTEINGEKYFAFYREREADGDEISRRMHRENI